MRSLYLFLGGLLLFGIGCNAEKQPPVLKRGTVVVAGQIDQVTARTVTLVFTDIIREGASYSQILDAANGRFNFSFDLFHAQDIWLRYDSRSIKLFVEPSDSLYITFSASDFAEESDNQFKSVKFSGAGKDINETMLQYAVFTGPSPANPNPTGKPAPEYLSALAKRIDLQKQKLTEFADLNSPAAKFVHWAENDIIYNNANLLVHYKAYRVYNKLPRSDSLFDLSLFPINDERSLVSSQFGPHLWHYVTDKYIQSDSTTLAYLLNENYYAAYERCVKDILQHEPQGIIRDIMVYKLLSSLFKESFDSFKQLWQAKENLIATPLLIEVLDNRVLAKADQTEGSVAFLGSMQAAESEFLGDVYDEILASSAEKLVYLDIWATWCGPCRAEIPYMIELHAMINGDSVEIISLCLDSDKLLWQQAIRENKIPGKHFFLDKAQSALFKSKLPFNGYPTYMIIKEGKIVDEQAPRPSAGRQLADQLEVMARQ